MKTLTNSLQNFLSRMFTLVGFVLGFYIAILFLVVLLLEEFRSGKVNQSMLLHFKKLSTLLNHHPPYGRKFSNNWSIGKLF